MDRIPRYTAVVDHDPRPSFVLAGEEAEALARFLGRRGSPVRESVVGPFRVFYDVDSVSLSALREARVVP